MASLHVLVLVEFLSCSTTETTDSAAPSLPSEAGDTACTDLLDNDDDGLADCDDPGCTSALACQGGEGSDALCADGGDNDLDGLADCDDPDCADTVPCLFEDTEARCVDGIDNDADGLIDCDDLDCAPTAPCLFEDTDSRCADGTDNDADGLIDCEDPDCAAVAPCLREDDDTRCADGADNDGDGLIDCDDPDCAPAFVCQEEPCTPYNEDDGQAPLGLVDLDAEGDIRMPYLPLGAAGDITGDGQTDLLLGSIDWLGLYSGPFSCDFLDDDPRLIAEIWSPWDPRTAEFLSYYGDVGDLDGDGAAEIAWGSYLGSETDPGRVRIFRGPLSGRVEIADADVTIEGRLGLTGWSVSMGDADGDGLADLLFGSPAPLLGNPTPGEAYLFHHPLVAHSVDDAEVVVEGRTDGSYAASGVSLHGDLNGDGLREVVVSAAMEGGCVSVFSNPSAGRFSQEDGDALLCGTGLGGATTVATDGDINGDGYDDLLTSRQGSLSCYYGILIFDGPISGIVELQSATAELCNSVGGGFGGAAVSVQDIDADGRDDVAVGETGVDGEERDGLVGLFYGPLSGLLIDTDAEAIFSATDDFGGLGYWLPSVGDVNGDGYGDLFFPAGAYRDVSYIVFGGAR